MEITAVFQSWTVGDGTLSPLSKNEATVISLALYPDIFSAVDDARPEKLGCLGGSDYEFCGRVRYVIDQRIMLVDAGGWLFSIEPVGAGRSVVAVGSRVSGVGTMVVDENWWPENVRAKYPNELFHHVTVTRIRKVNTPEQFLSRDQSGKVTSAPGWVKHTDYAFENVAELETMEGQPFREEFYLVDFSRAMLNV